MDLILHWIIQLLALSVSVLIITYILPGINVKGFGTAVVVALIYGLLKFFLTGILTILSLPLIILTLGLFYFVINAFLLWITSKVVEGFEVKGCITTVIAAFLISVIEILIRYLTSVIYYNVIEMPPIF
ncbi:phage holin family protein [Candidatus Poribacteria bacterium]|nr:MAG: phage holin family protein [Candidatus Poribacteria bacterium]